MWSFILTGSVVVLTTAEEWTALEENGVRLTKKAGTYADEAVVNLGPWCFEGQCQPKEGAEACKKIDGIDVGGMFCLTTKRMNVLGPFCRDGQCLGRDLGFKDEVKAACESIGGTDVASMWCLTEKESMHVLGPFCVKGSKCYDGSAACEKVGGADIKGTFCLTEAKVKSLGPFCHESKSKCMDAAGKQACEAVQGESIAGIFCIAKDGISALGPWCHENVDPDRSGIECVQGAGRTACLNKDIDGKDIDGTFCLTQNNVHVLGPFCDEGRCKGSNACTSINGQDVDGAWCLVNRDNDVNMLGPFRYGSTWFSESQGNKACGNLGGASVFGKWCLTNVKDVEALGPLCQDKQCYRSDGATACAKFNGENIDGGFCLAKGAKALGPFCHDGDCMVASASTACEQVAGTNVGGVFCLTASNAEKPVVALGPFCHRHTCAEKSAAEACKTIGGHDIHGKFCLTQENVQVLGPFCNGNDCKEKEATEACKKVTQKKWGETKFGGIDVDGMFCLVPHVHHSVMPDGPAGNNGDSSEPGSWFPIIVVVGIIVVIAGFFAYNKAAQARAREDPFEGARADINLGSFQHDRVELQPTHWLEKANSDHTIEAQS